jgi:aminoglycoside phosphotransferase (APT) family kinase protein
VIVAATGCRVTAATITYVRYKPGRSCLVGYRVQTPVAPADVTATARRADSADKLANAVRRPARRGALGEGRFLLTDSFIVVSTFPNDERLTALPALTDADRRPRLLAKLLPHRPELWPAQMQTLRYKPGRRLVARLDVDGRPRAVLKAYTPAGFAAAQANAKAVHRRPMFRIPERLGRSTRHGITAMEWLEGRLLADALADPMLDPAAVQAVGAALAGFHAARGVHVPRRTPGDLAKVLPPIAAWLAIVDPALGTRSARLSGLLLDRLPRAPVSWCPVHGDFYAKQVILADGSVGLIDFDEAYRGDPASDLGLFIAHLERDGICGTIDPRQVKPLEGALLEGYRSAAGAVPRRVGLYTAVGLLRLAPHPFRNREPDWPDRTAAMLDRATNCVPNDRRTSQTAGAQP